MKNTDLILAKDLNGQKIYIKTLEKWLADGNQKELADFFFDRFYTRYLKPFDYKHKNYITSYKNGFAIMASCCLLIETFISYTNNEFKNNRQKSERSFGYFFLTNKEFICFSEGGLELNKYEKQLTKYLNNRGIPKDFYSNVRCGILHNGETKNNWKIIREGDLFDKKNKTINASEFLKNLVIVIERFRNSLLKADFDNDEIWKTYKSRLIFMIEKSYTN
ncbi:MAG: hypothetical protein JJE55_03655 [Flavobacteriaceae bacterium]|nr:hypothetical protein [Flavobacteriaceae bacterium]